MQPLLKGLQETLLRAIIFLSLEVPQRPFPSQVLCGIEAQTSLEAKQPQGQASSTTAHGPSSAQLTGAFSHEQVTVSSALCPGNRDTATSEPRNRSSCSTTQQNRSCISK